MKLTRQEQTVSDEARSFAGTTFSQPACRSPAASLLRQTVDGTCFSNINECIRRSGFLENPGVREEGNRVNEEQFHHSSTVSQEIWGVEGVIFSRSDPN